MAQDLFAELMSMAAKPKKKEPKAPVTFADKFKKAVQVQREKVALIGKPEYKKANTDCVNGGVKTGQLAAQKSATLARA